MKLIKSIFISVLVLPMWITAQESKDSVAPATKAKLERTAFESSALIDNQTNVVYTKGTIEFTMNHRFGLVNGTNDMIGIWAPANIRLGLTYSITNCIAVGLGASKDNRFMDFNLKGALLKQTRDNHMPISVTFYGNAVRSDLPKSTFKNDSDRFSFFSQLIIARRFSPNISILVAPSVSHYNYIERPMKGDVFAATVGGRVKITPSAAVIVESTIPISTYKGSNDIKPGIGLGLEYSTGSHAFQLFVTNYKGIMPQQNIVFNQNDFFRSQYLIGFNITRLWHL